MAVRWNCKMFGRRPGDVDDGEAPMGVDVLLAAGVVSKVKGRKAKQEEGKDADEGSEAP